jgi:hypothetical protein
VGSLPHAECGHFNGDGAKDQHKKTAQARRRPQAMLALEVSGMEIDRCRNGFTNHFINRLYLKVKYIKTKDKY